jgi:outer membrane protein
MEKSSKIVQVVLIIAVVVLFVLHFLPKSGSVSEKAKANITDTALVVYINADSLLMSYDFAKQLNEELLKKEEKSRADFNEQAKIFQQDLGEFQRKVQNNGFLSLDRAKAEEQRLGRKERELQDLNAKLSNQLMLEQNSMNKQLRDSLTSFLKELQPKMKFQLVLSNTMGDNVLYGSASADITKVVIDGMNARYAKSKE